MEDEQRRRLAEFWYHVYNTRPYLRVASDQDVRLRIEDVVRNICALTPEGKVGAIPVDQGGRLWAQKLMEVRVECPQRDLALESAIRCNSFTFNKNALRLVHDNQQLVPFLDEKNIFCKYGKFEWMKELLEKGSLLLSPASFYNEPSLGVARQDNELTLPVVFTPYDHDRGQVPKLVGERIPDRAWAIVDCEKPCDHYTYCVTVGFDLRFFMDFGDTGTGKPAEACILIRDQDEFQRRLENGIRRALPAWHVSFGMVKYVDPYCVAQILPNTGNEIFYFKDIRYLYRREHRAIALPPDGIDGPFDQRVSVEMGPLNDIAELVVLRT